MVIGIGVIKQTSITGWKASLDSGKNRFRKKKNASSNGQLEFEYGNWSEEDR